MDFVGQTDDRDVSWGRQEGGDLHRLIALGGIQQMDGKRSWRAHVQRWCDRVFLFDGRWRDTYLSGNVQRTAFFLSSLFLLLDHRHMVGACDGSAESIVQQTRLLSWHCFTALSGLDYSAECEPK